MTPIAVCATSTMRTAPPRSTGKERDAESGNDYFGARYYASSMGRWLSPDFNSEEFDPDPVPYADLENPQSLNLYSYVQNNPLSRIDPVGHEQANDPCAGISNCVSVTAKPDPPPPLEQTFFSTYIFNKNAGLNIAMTLAEQGVLVYSKAHGKGERNRTSKPTDKPIKGAKPVKDKNGKIIGWQIPSDDGKGKNKSLEWGKQNGLDADDPKWAKMGAVAAGAGAAATIWAVLEDAAAGALLAF
jgi:RHS repeat-associated protein